MPPRGSSGPESLLVLWTSGDRHTALNTTLLDGLNAMYHDWWSGATLLTELQADRQCPGRIGEEGDDLREETDDDHSDTGDHQRQFE